MSGSAEFNPNGLPTFEMDGEATEQEVNSELDSNVTPNAVITTELEAILSSVTTFVEDPPNDLGVALDAGTAFVSQVFAKIEGVDPVLALAFFPFQLMLGFVT